MLKITVRCTCTTMHVEDPVCRVLCVSRCFVHLKQEVFLRKMSWDADTQMLWNHAASIIYTDWMSRAVPCKDVFTLTAIHSIEATGSSFSVTADYVRATFDNTSVLSDIMKLSLSRNYGCTILWKKLPLWYAKKKRDFLFLCDIGDMKIVFFSAVFAKWKISDFFQIVIFCFSVIVMIGTVFFAIFVMWKNTGFCFL